MIVGLEIQRAFVLLRCLAHSTRVGEHIRQEHNLVDVIRIIRDGRLLFGDDVSVRVDDHLIVTVAPEAGEIDHGHGNRDHGTDDEPGYDDIGHSHLVPGSPGRSFRASSTTGRWLSRLSGSARALHHFVLTHGFEYTSNRDTRRASVMRVHHENASRMTLGEHANPLVY